MMSENQQNGKMSQRGRIPPLILIALALLLVFILALLALCPGKTKTAEKPSERTVSLSEQTARSVPTAEYVRKARPEIRLSINDNPDSQVLFSDLECLFEIRVLNWRAHLARFQARQNEILKVSLDRQVSEGTISEDEAKNTLERSPQIEPEPIELGTAEISWISMVHLYAVRMETNERAEPVELSPERLSSGQETANQLRLGGENEGILRFIGSPDGLGLAHGNYQIYAALQALDTPEHSAYQISGDRRSTALPVSIAPLPDPASPEVLDLRTYTQAKIAAAREDLDGAKGILEEGIRNNPKATMSLILRADLLEAEKRYEEAYKSLKQAFDAVLERGSDSEDFREPPSYLVERMNQIRKLMAK